MNAPPDPGPGLPPAAQPPAGRSRARWKWLLVPVAVVILIGAVRHFQAEDRLRAALEWVGQLGPGGVVVFIAIYVAAAILCIPGSILTLGAGAVYGVTWGVVYASIASTLGATGAFLVSRHLARKIVVRRFAGNERFAAIDRAVAAEGWKIVVLTRLSPMFPFILLNYGFGLTRVKLSHYVVASWLGMMPATVLYVYLGALAKAATGARTRTPVEWALYGVGLLATVGVSVFIMRLAQRALAAKVA